MSPASYQTAPPRVALLALYSMPVHPSSPARAGNGTRTRDPNLGKVVLYQLSYSRALCKSNRSVGLHLPPPFAPLPPPPPPRPPLPAPYRPSGGEGDRTPDLVNAIHALSQLSYAPVIFAAPQTTRREHGILPGRSGGVKRFSCRR